MYVPPKFAPSTLRGYLEAIANVLLHYDKKKFKPLVRSLFNTGLSMQQRIDKQNEVSELTEQEKKNFVPYEELARKREQLQAEWNIAPDSLKLNMYHLILAFNVLVPPLRLNLIDMQIYPPLLIERKGDYSGPPPENKINYLWQYEPGKWAYCINYDKIQNKREKSGKPRQIIRFEDEIPNVTQGKLLNTIINKSVELVPRNYVLTAVKTKKPMGVSSYDAALREIFKPKQPRQNLIR